MLKIFPVFVRMSCDLIYAACKIHKETNIRHSSAHILMSPDSLRKRTGQKSGCFVLLFGRLLCLNTLCSHDRKIRLEENLYCDKK